MALLVSEAANVGIMGRDLPALLLLQVVSLDMLTAVSPLGGMGWVRRSVSVSRYCFLCCSPLLCGPGFDRVPGSKVSVSLLLLCRNPVPIQDPGSLTPIRSKKSNPWILSSVATGNAATIVASWTSGLSSASYQPEAC